MHAHPESARDDNGHYIGQYRPCTGPEVSNFLKAKAMGIPPHPRGYHLRNEIEDFLRAKGVLP